MTQDYFVLPDPADRDAAMKMTAEVLYQNWTEVQEMTERQLSNFWGMPRRERMAVYEALGPVFAVEPTDLGLFTLQMEQDELDPALALTEPWAAGYRMNPKEVRRMIRDLFSILRREERETQKFLEGETERETRELGESLLPDPALTQGASQNGHGGQNGQNGAGMY